MVNWGIAVLVLLLIGAFLHTARQRPQLFCPSRLDASTVETYQNRDLNCIKDVVKDGEGIQRTVEECQKFKLCTPCPENGTCDDSGKLTCNVGFVQENRICVENQIVRDQAMVFLKSFENSLKTLKGDYICGKKASYEVKYQQLSEQLRETGMALNDNNEKETEILVSKVTEQLNLNAAAQDGALDIHWKMAGEWTHDPEITKSNA